MKKRLLPKRLSVRLTLTYVIVFALVLALLSVGIVWGVEYFLIRDAEADVTQTLDVLAERVLDEYYEGEPLDDPEIMQGYATDGRYNIMIQEHSGSIISTSRNFDMPNEAFQYAGETPAKYEYDDNAVIIQQCVVSAGETKIAKVSVARSLANERSFLRITMRLLLIFDAIGFLIAVCAGLLVSRRMLVPIEAMTRTAKRVSMSSLNERLDVSDKDDELNSLAGTFNSMLDRLQASFDAQTRFVSDASHELRTPLMVIQGYADVLDRWGKNDLNVLDESVRAITQEADGMGRLMDKLLFLARSDSGVLKLNKTSFNMAELFREIEREYSLLYTQHLISFSCADEIFLLADRTLIKQALRALLDNAFKYTPTKGRITLGCEINETNIFITVEDTGEGIAAIDIPKLFDRFYRVDAVRDKATGGVGLGLSIVQEIIKAHVGTVQVRSEPGKGTMFIISLHF